MSSIQDQPDLAHTRLRVDNRRDHRPICEVFNGIVFHQTTFWKIILGGPIDEHSPNYTNPKLSAWESPQRLHRHQSRDRHLHNPHSPSPHQQHHLNNDHHHTSYSFHRTSPSFGPSRRIIVWPPVRVCVRVHIGISIALCDTKFYCRLALLASTRTN